MGKYWQGKRLLWGKMSVITAALLLGQIGSIATVHAASTDITINEISSYGDSGDWVELYNKGSDAVDISSWSLKDNFLTVVKSDAFSATTIPSHGFVTVDFGNALEATGDTISLYDVDAGSDLETPPIETVEYGTMTIPAPMKSSDSVARVTDGSALWAVGPATKAATNVPPDTTPPPIPSGGQSTVNGNSATLDWSAVTDDRPGDVRYRMRLAATQSDLPTATPTDVSTNQFVASPLSDGTYYWQVQAVDPSNNPSGWSEVWQFTITPADTTAPEAPASSVGNGEVLSGTKIIETSPTSDTSSWRFEIYHTSSGQLVITSSDPSFIFDTSRFANGQYILKYIVTDAAGNTASHDILFSIANIVVTEAPQLPTAPSLVQSSSSLKPQITNDASTSTSPSPEDEEISAITNPQISASDVLNKDNNDSLAVAASDKGWQFFGYPWYVWVSGGIGVGIASWLVRRIIITRGGDSG